MATYILGDLDRLSSWQLELAARAARMLNAGGARVLNDPARVLQRYAMLRKLHRIGLNRFRVWSLEHDDEPDRFPVFLRTASAHRGVMSDLLPDAAAVRAAAEALVAEGIPLKELLAVEYAAEPVGHVFRKHAAYRIGDRVVTTLSVHDSSWNAKIGVEGIAGADLYAEELAFVRDERFAPAVLEAFEAAQIDYGRADFGVVDGKVQVYEINTNPAANAVREHPFADRLEADRLSRERYAEAMTAVDTPAGAPIEMRQAELDLQRRRDRWALRERYVI